jgi:hypothetical protein
LFPGKRVIAIPLDVGNPMPGAPVAWEALDAVVSDGRFVGADVRTFRALLGSGVAFAIRSQRAPDSTWPWRRRGDWWVLRYEPTGPMTAVSPAAYAPVRSWAAGVPARTRALIVGVGVLTAIAALAATLLRGRIACLALAAVVVGSLLGFGAWSRRQSPVRKVESVVSTIDRPLVQNDLWEFQTSAVPAEMTFNSFADTRPILASPEQVERQGVTLVCAGDGSLSRVTARLGRGEALACLSKLVEPMKGELQPLSDQRNSPMWSVVREAYLAPQIRALGESKQNGGGVWPGIVLEREPP